LTLNRNHGLTPGKKYMNDQHPIPAATNTFERIKRINERGGEFWSARELARVLEYSDFRNFITVITKAREACAKSGHTVADHFGDFSEMVNIGSGAQRELDDWALSRYACYPRPHGEHRIGREPFPHDANGGNTPPGKSPIQGLGKSDSQSSGAQSPPDHP
jgi:DNA-directed RNA polymerase subunit N (RpoN/RPB10)